MSTNVNGSVNHETPHEAPALQRITILGATGSIGSSTLDVIARHPERYRVHALSAATRHEALLELCLTHRPQVAVIASCDAAEWLSEALKGVESYQGTPIEVRHGEQALVDISEAPEVDSVMAAIVGAAGLLPTLAAVRAGKRVLLANKEALVCAGQLFMDAVKQHGATLLPIDSEHNDAEWPAERLATVTPDEACAHPNWSMGRKISVDSATLMNKGLELIEACWLFACGPDDIQVVVHPQSVIHSMAAYSDGSVLAQMGNPDMRTPIAYALAWPERIDAGVEPLDLFQVARLDFRAADETRFPCLRLAREAIAAGGTWPAVMNAANEVAVAAFLEGRLAFDRIPAVVQAVMQARPPLAVDGLEVILAEDAAARELAAAELALAGP